MSSYYQNNYGYDQNGDTSLSMKENIHPNEYSCLKAYQYNDNLVVMQFKIIDDKLISGYESKAIYKIESDYENISKYQVCRYLNKTQGIITYPYTNTVNPMVYVFEEYLNQNVINNLSLKLGLKLKNLNELYEESELYEYEDDYSFNILMFNIYNYLLNHNFQTFTQNGEFYGIVCKINNSYLEACTIRNISFNRISGMGELLLEMTYYKINPFTSIQINELLDNTDDKTTLIDNHSYLNDWVTIDKSNSSAIFLPTNQEVIIQAITKFPNNNYYKLIKDKQKNNQLINDYENYIFLTNSDKCNRKRGYNLYVPDTYEKFQLYWELCYGIILPKETSFTSTYDDLMIFVNIIINESEQIVPLQSLVRGIAEMPSKSHKDSMNIALSDIHHCLNNTSWFDYLLPPITCHELQMKQSKFLTTTTTNININNNTNNNTNNNNNNSYQQKQQMTFNFTSALQLKRNYLECYDTKLVNADNFTKDKLKKINTYIIMDNNNNNDNKKITNNNRKNNLNNNADISGNTKKKNNIDNNNNLNLNNNINNSNKSNSTNNTNINSNKINKNKINNNSNKTTTNNNRNKTTNTSANIQVDIIISTPENNKRDNIDFNDEDDDLFTENILNTSKQRVATTATTTSDIIKISNNVMIKMKKRITKKK